MKARWKIILTLLIPLLLIFSGVYLKLTLSAKQAKSGYVEYYTQVARPAIDVLNKERSKADGAGNQYALSEAERMNAMSAMLKHSENQRRHQATTARNRILGYTLIGAWALAALFLGIGLLDREKMRMEPTSATLPSAPPALPVPPA